MTPKHEDLWRRIQEFPIDEGPVELPFVRRLARENAWTDAHAERVVAEYRKFLLLAMAAGHPVSPSDAVDQAWHLHLTYSKSYWIRLCGEVLQRPLHHYPTQGGESEQRKYRDAYARTLESYRRMFGSPPPDDLWPDPSLRFGRDLEFQRINRSENTVVSRRRLRQLGVLAWLLAAVAGLAFPFWEEITATVGESLRKRGSEFLQFYGITLVAALAAGFVFRRGLQQAQGAPRAEDLQLHPYEAAYLAGGEQGAVDAALVQLFRAGKLRHQPDARTLHADGVLSGDAQGLDRALHQTARSPVPVAKLRSGAAASLEALADGLRARGLMVSAGQAILGTVVPLAMLALPMLLGLLKVVEALQRGRPTGFLLASMTFTGVAAWWIYSNRLRCSARGRRALQRLRESHPLQEIGAQAAMTWGVALYGLTVLADTSWAGLTGTLRPPVATGGAGDGGGGCGGGGDGGCGGGCGGCGGCG